jgi:hypothetical protein
MKKILRMIRLAAIALLAGTLLSALAAPAVYAATGHRTVVMAVVDGTTIEIPTAPAAVLVIAGFLSTYVISAINGVLAFVKQEWQRKAVSVIGSLGLGGVSLTGYYLVSGDPLPADPGGWFMFALLVVVVCQASYSLVTKRLGAKAIERAASA